MPTLNFMDEPRRGPHFATKVGVDMATVEHIFPMACPECRSLEGMPTKVETRESGAVCVALRCQLCRYEWTVKMSDGEVAVAPKRDRRVRSR